MAYHFKCTVPELMKRMTVKEMHSWLIELEDAWYRPTLDTHHLAQVAQETFRLASRVWGKPSDVPRSAFLLTKEEEAKPTFSSADEATKAAKSVWAARITGSIGPPNE